MYEDEEVSVGRRGCAGGLWREPTFAYLAPLLQAPLAKEILRDVQLLTSRIHRNLQLTPPNAGPTILFTSVLYDLLAHVK